MARHVFDLNDLWKRIVSYVNARLQSLSDLTDDDIREVCDFEDGMDEERVVPKATADTLGCVKVGDGLNVDDGVLSNGAADYIVERGTSGVWTYEKWASGKAECWLTTYRKETWNTASGAIMGGYYAQLSNPSWGAFPFTFSELPTAEGFARLGTGIGFLGYLGYDETKITNLSCEVNQNSTSVFLETLRVIGKWK